MTDTSIDESVKGKRVRITKITDEWTDLKAGATGTALYFNNYHFNNENESTLFVKWDDDSTLGLIVGLDEWEWID